MRTGTIATLTIGGRDLTVVGLSYSLNRPEKVDNPFSGGAVEFSCEVKFSRRQAKLFYRYLRRAIKRSRDSHRRWTHLGRAFAARDYRPLSGVEK